MPNNFLSKLFLIVILYQVILNEGQSGCNAGNAGKLRLRGGIKIAGLVQICMKENVTYDWFNVCSDGWGKNETTAVCELQIDKCNIGKLPV